MERIREDRENEDSQTLSQDIDDLKERYHRAKIGVGLLRHKRKNLGMVKRLMEEK